MPFHLVFSWSLPLCHDAGSPQETSRLLSFVVWFYLFYPGKSWFSQLFPGAFLYDLTVEHFTRSYLAFTMFAVLDDAGNPPTL